MDGDKVIPSQSGYLWIVLPKKNLLTGWSTF